MREETDKKIVKETGSEEFYFVGFEDDKTECNAKFKIYQSENAEKTLIAVSNDDSEKVSFEVHEDDGVFEVY
ncbi:hypothetical protein [Poseidonibacter ostreae]|uniref:Uncharacterized protein n=1 Tax=Poseidonibacter ostreae TaxID=2654171 RepID=A0A6L4WY83_9BACT|nr:hypothetical protein [Poseidonibacter ostreae]KAB7891430.1 hypothetical protein GBG19_00915 [Poseidonibacter ostreae]